ncbi:hypothetical protein AB833_27725 [Chromatiales bacterium (ex Bugula neritina AB1)]|nr:hypothetical protein AB833_27725 [Chromatiales bacterium (ex Bugula neritina AB1)]
MNDVDRALVEISDIRSRMASSATFQGFGPRVIALTGVLSFVTALAQSLYYASSPADVRGFLLVWAGVAVLSTALIGTEMIARSYRIHGGLADAMIINAAEQFIPAGVVGLIVALVLDTFAPELLWLLPGIWQLLLAMAIFATARTLTRRVNLVAAWYLIAGTTVLILSAQSLTVGPWSMGIPFVVGQLLMAAVLVSATGKSDER